jgi:hypothetical protein
MALSCAGFGLANIGIATYANAVEVTLRAACPIRGPQRLVGRSFAESLRMQIFFAQKIAFDAQSNRDSPVRRFPNHHPAFVTAAFALEIPKRPCCRAIALRQRSPDFVSSFSIHSYAPSPEKHWLAAPLESWKHTGRAPNQLLLQIWGSDLPIPKQLAKVRSQAALHNLMCMKW